MTTKQMRRKKPINTDMLVDIEPLTDNQKVLFDAYDEGKNIFAYGAAGTGKTFISLYKALQDVLNDETPYEKLYIVRSLVSTREIGFLPGDHDDKSALYQIPYKNMVKYMFEMATDADFEMLYGNLKTQETISFWSTSFIRGTTMDNCIVLVDEMQNLNFHELDSIITRVGDNCKIIFCGDATQTDLTKSYEKDGIIDFKKIIEVMEEDFGVIEFGLDDIVRSGLVRNYLVTKLARFMTFVHLDKAKRFRSDGFFKTIDGVRYYDTPSGKPMPSITSVTSFYNRKVFQDWRLVLVKKKNKVSRVSTRRGSLFHELVEVYLKNEDVKAAKPLPSTMALFVARRIS